MVWTTGSPNEADFVNQLIEDVNEIWIKVTLMMKHVVSSPTQPFLGSKGEIEIHQVPVWQDNLCWILVGCQSRKGWVVDGPQASEVLDYAATHQIELVGILNTHTHGDHIGINRDLAKRGMLDSLRVIGPGLVREDVPGLTDAVGEGDTVDLGSVVARVLQTEGHIDGHVSYVADDVLFCGDTLFAGGCGYLFDGPPEKMFRSLMRLSQLPGQTRVCCAHEYTEDNLRFAWMIEPDNEALAARIQAVWNIRSAGGCTVPSTIAEERETNPFLRPGSPTILRELEARMPDADLSSPVKVFAATRALKDRKDHRSRSDDLLPLVRD